MCCLLLCVDGCLLVVVRDCGTLVVRFGCNCWVGWLLFADGCLFIV